MTRLDELWPENAESWRIFSMLNTVLVSEFGLAAYMLTAVTATWSAEDRVALVTRLEIIRSLLPHGPETQTRHRR